MNNTENEVINHWKANGFVGLQKLHKILKQNNISIKLRDLKDLIAKQKTAQVHKTFRKNQKTLGHIVSFSNNYKWNLDLSDMSAYSAQNRGYKFILLAVDIFSRKAIAEPLKNKSEKEVTTAFNKIISKEKPKMITSDSGSEFTNNQFKQNAEEQNINLQTVQVGDHQALGIIDRLTRTLKEMTFKHFTQNNTTNWIDHLDTLINTYNNLSHRGINDYKPNEVKDHVDEIVDLNIKKKEEENNLDPVIKVGDKVRKKLKSFMRKGYEPKWSNEVFVVEKINKSSAILGDKTRMKLDDLSIANEVHENVVTQKDIPNVTTNSSTPLTNVEPIDNVIERAKNQNKKDKNFKKSGLDKSDIVEGKREKRQPKNRIGITE